MIESPKDFAARIYGMIEAAGGASGSAPTAGGSSSSGAAQEVDAEVV